MKQTTALRLKELMEKRNLRQVDILNLTKPLCEEYGIKMNKSDLSQYCSGKTEPNQEKLFVLGKALDVNEAWLMGFDVPMERIDWNMVNIESEQIPNEEYKIIFSRNLKKYMELNNKTQADLINDLGFSSSTISNWCTGLKLPRMGKIQLIADYFGIKKSDLIEDKPEQQDTKLTKKDERDISNTVSDLMKTLESNDGSPLYFEGQELSPETKILFEQQLKALVTTVKEINKVKYNPNKNKK